MYFLGFLFIDISCFLLAFMVPQITFKIHENFPLQKRYFIMENRFLDYSNVKKRVALF